MLSFSLYRSARPKKHTYNSLDGFQAFLYALQLVSGESKRNSVLLHLDGSYQERVQ